MIEANESCGRPRAPHLPQDERRAALIAATRRALLELGAVPTTRQIAEAAGVAEGTIFRVFDSKEALLDAVIADSFNNADLLEAVAGIDPAVDLRERLYRLVAIVQHRFQRIFGLMAALGMVAPPHVRDEHARERAARGGPAMTAALASVIGRDGHLLRGTPDEAVHMLRLLTFAGSNPYISHGHVLTPQQIVDVLLDGLLVRHEPPEARPC